MLFDRSSWSQKHSSTNTTYIHLAREYWVSSRSYETHHLANMWKQHKRKRWDIYYREPTRVKILPLPHSIKADTACVHTECTQSHICNKAASHLCQFASSKHLRHSILAFILGTFEHPATNTAAQHVVRIEKYSLVIPFQALWQMRTGTSTKIIEVRGRFPKAARTLVILADTEWYIRSPRVQRSNLKPRWFSLKPFPGNFRQGHSGISEPHISSLIWWSEIIQANLEWLLRTALWKITAFC